MSIDLGKKTGAVNLTKGQRVTIEKTPKITATVTFTSKTDYDVYAVVLYKDGTEKVASTFGSKAQPDPTPTVDGVRHLGDVQRGGGSDLNTEIMEITLNDQIDQIAVVAYSAQSNGSGSFRKYKVSLMVDNGAGTMVTVDAKSANSNDSVYTCVPAIIRNTDGGVVIDQVEMYSRPNSEHRPAFTVPDANEVTSAAPVKRGLFGFKKGAATASQPVPQGEYVFVMDAGSRNQYK